MWLCFFEEYAYYLYFYYYCIYRIAYSGKSVSVLSTGQQWRTCLAYTLSPHYFQAFGLTPQQMQQIGNNSGGHKQHRRNISSPEQVVQSIREEAEKREWPADQ